MNTKKERTEYVGLYMTPTMAKQIKEANDNEQLKDKLLKTFVTNETEWLKEEIHNMDEITVLYRAKLLTIKDKFSEAQGIYVEEIEKLLNKSDDAIKPLSQKFTSLKKEIESVKTEVESTYKAIESISSKIGYIDYTKIERLLDAVDRFNKMDESEKELIRLILQK